MECLLPKYGYLSTVIIQFTVPFVPVFFYCTCPLDFGHLNMKSTCLKIDKKQHMLLPKQQQIVVNCTLSAYNFSYKFNKR